MPEFALVIITQGRGMFESRESGLIAFSADSLIVLFPGVWHRYKPDEATEYTLMYTPVNEPTVSATNSTDNLSTLSDVVIYPIAELVCVIVIVGIDARLNVDPAWNVTSAVTSPNAAYAAFAAVCCA